MGSASSIETRASMRASRKATLVKSVQSYRDQTNKSSDSANAALGCDESSRHARTTNFKANDRVSFAVALQDYDYEGSNHTCTTQGSESVVCIVRSDRLAFAGTGIRRHSRRKRLRQKGKDTTRIIVLRQPSRLDSTMMKVDERIPTKQLKKPLKKLTAGKKIAPASPYPALMPEKTIIPPRASRKSKKRPLFSPLKSAARTSSTFLSRKSSDTFTFDDACSRDNVLSMSISSRDYTASGEFLACQ